MCDLQKGKDVKNIVLVKMAHERCLIYIQAACAILHLYQDGQGEDVVQIENLMHLLNLMTSEFNNLENMLDEQVSGLWMQQAAENGISVT